MRMRSILKTTLFAAAATVLGAGAAFAAPKVTFTWDPSLTSPNGVLSSASPNSPIVTANNLTVADYAVINLSNPNAVTESGILAVTAYALQGGSHERGFVNGQGGGSDNAIGGATPYQLYFTFSSVSHVGPDGSGGLKGAFDSISYTLFGDIGGNCTFAVGGASCPLGEKQLVLATGGLSGQGLNSVSINGGGVPSANVNLTILEGADAGGFFVIPNDLTGFNFETAFTNTTGAFSQVGPIITIDGGGGNVDLVKVPEPFTLSLFGAGLAGAAAVRRRKAKKA